VCCFVALATEEDSRHSHLLFTLSVYQYRVQMATTHGHNNGLTPLCITYVFTGICLSLVVASVFQ